MYRLNQEDTKDESFKLRLFINTKARGGLGWDIIRLVGKIYYKLPPGGWLHRHVGALYCTKCNLLLKWTSGDHKIMNRHMISKHGDYLKEAKELSLKRSAKASEPMTSWLSKSNKRMKPAGDGAKDEVKRLVAKWVAGSLRPIQVCEDPGLVDLVKYVNELSNSIELPRRTSLKDEIKKMASEGRAELMDIIAGKSILFSQNKVPVHIAK